MIYEYVLLFITVTGIVDFSEKDRETTTLILRVFNLVIKISFFSSPSVFLITKMSIQENILSRPGIARISQTHFIPLLIPIFIQMNSGRFFLFEFNPRIWAHVNTYKWNVLCSGKNITKIHRIRHYVRRYEYIWFGSVFGGYVLLHPRVMPQSNLIF